MKSQTRIHPPPPRGLWPFLTASDLSVDPTNHIRVVSFSHRPQAQSAQFYDYSARYGAVREQDRLTLQQYLLNNTASDDTQAITGPTLQLAESLELTSLLHLPLIALSNGQTRRARIFKALVQQPKVLILDEPLSMRATIIIYCLCNAHIFSQLDWTSLSVPVSSHSSNRSMRPHNHT